MWDGRIRHMFGLRLFLTSRNLLLGLRLVVFGRALIEVLDRWCLVDGCCELLVELLTELFPLPLGNALGRTWRTSKSTVGQGTFLARRRVLATSRVDNAGSTKLARTGFADILRSVERVCVAATVQCTTFWLYSMANVLHNRPGWVLA